MIRTGKCSSLPMAAERGTYWLVQKCSVAGPHHVAGCAVQSDKGLGHHHPLAVVGGKGERGIVGCTLLQFVNFTCEDERLVCW